MTDSYVSELLVSQIRRNKQNIFDRISKAGVNPKKITIIAVTKGFPEQVIQAGLQEGFYDLGESYAKELNSKASCLQGSIRWNFLGSIQKRQVGSIAHLVSLWHSVDRIEEAKAIAKYSPGASILLQVNTNGQPQQGGCQIGEVESLVEQFRSEGLDVRGLMTLGLNKDLKVSRDCFRSLATLGQKLDLAELSMGMSNDLEVAVQEGSTMLRIGRALFGSRVSPVNSKCSV